MTGPCAVLPQPVPCLPPHRPDVNDEGSGFVIERNSHPNYSPSWCCNSGPAAMMGPPPKAGTPQAPAGMGMPMPPLVEVDHRHPVTGPTQAQAAFTAPPNGGYQTPAFAPPISMLERESSAATAVPPEDIVFMQLVGMTLARLGALQWAEAWVMILDSLRKAEFPPLPHVPPRSSSQ